MEKHHNTQDTVSNAGPSAFNAFDALETLHAQLVKIEALAAVAGELADRLQPPSARELKRELIRMQIFVGQTALEASRAVADVIA